MPFFLEKKTLVIIKMLHWNRPKLTSGVFFIRQ